MQETQVLSLGPEDPWRRKWKPTRVLLPGKYHGQRGLAGYSPWGRYRVGHDLVTKQQQQIWKILLPDSSVGKEPAGNAGDPCIPVFNSWVGKIPWRRDRLPTPVFMGFPCGSAGEESTCNVGDLGSIPGLRRSGERKGYSLQYSGLENLKVRQDWGTFTFLLENFRGE